MNPSTKNQPSIVPWSSDRISNPSSVLSSVPTINRSSHPSPRTHGLAATCWAALLGLMCASQLWSQTSTCEAFTAVRNPDLPEGQYEATDGIFRLYGLHAHGASAGDYFLEDPESPLQLIHDADEGTIAITGKVHCREDETQVLDLHLAFYDERQAACWLEEGGSNSLLISYDPSNGYATCPHDPDSMSVFLMSPESHAILEGSWSGTLLFYHMPVSGNKRFQYGLAGSEHSCNDGFGGWFAYSGLVDGMDVFGLSADIHADVKNCSAYNPGQTPAALCACDAELKGCTDDEACNYIATALCDDGSCDYTCCPGPGCCATGMHWDVSLGMCVNSVPGDSDGDGCVGLPDLLILLTGYNSCGTSDAEGLFGCGDPVSYQGYDYATVLIGDQCWFAENLRSENYDNGDAIPAGLSDSEWSSTTSGATAVYGEGSSDCYTYTPDGDACDEAWSLNEYGRLYNWYAVDDARGLCPSGWHVPTDGEWMTMEMALGMSESEANSTGWRGTDQGTQMKTTYGWNGGGNGTNSSGFSGLPVGYRSIDGNFSSAGNGGNWWSSSPDGSDAWSRYLYDDDESVFRGVNYLRFGFSVRCVRDAE